MDNSSELEIAVRRGAGGEGDVRSYSVEMRFQAPDSDTEDRLIQDGDATLRLDPNQFNQPISSWQTYGQRLREAFFQDPKIQPAFAMALSRTAPDASLRVRFYIEPKAVELQRIHWEAMADPNPARPMPLFANPRVAFSRYLNSGDFRPVRSRQNAERLKALIVVSNPSDLAARGMAPIPPEPEVSRAVDAFAGHIDYATVVSQSASPGATLKNIVAELSKGVDILYLVCHGLAMQRPDQSWESVLCLEKADGTLERVAGDELVQSITDLDERPRLIVLASCQSAGDALAADPDADSFVAAIGPRFAEAGIPAVLAMSGNLTVDTAKRFIPTFFKELLSEKGAGRIDRAVALARQEVKDRPDCWMPLLFMRLRSGRVWYVAGFTDDRALPWDSICDYVATGDFVPIVGPDLPALVEGSSKDHAARMAADCGFPLAPWNSNDLSKVAQYMLTNTGVDPVRRKVRELRMDGVRKKFPDLASTLDGRALLEAIVTGFLKDAENPYTVLTNLLQAPVYLTTTPDSLLEIALTKSGRPPVEYPCRWRDDRRDGLAAVDFTPAAPGLFYVFGKSTAKDEQTWALTEDDVFDYLIHTSRNPLWPEFVPNAIANGTLFFIGFPVDDWKFRVLVRMILGMECAAMVRSRNHICVQVDPEETSLADAVRARRYFERCFSANPKIDIYWGTSREFLRDLSRQLAIFTAKNPGAAKASGRAAAANDC